MHTVKVRVEDLLLSPAHNPENLLCASYGAIFLAHKNSSQNSKYQISAFDLEINQREIQLIFNMILRPLF